MQSGLYANFKLARWYGQIDLSVNDLWVLLLTAAHEPGLDRHKTLADLTGEVQGEGYTAGGKPLPGKKVEKRDGNDCLCCQDMVWPNATFSARYAVLYQKQGGLLVALGDLGKEVGSTSGEWVLAFEGGKVLEL